MKSLHMFSRNTSAKGKKCAWEQHSLLNADGKMALNSDVNMQSADWVQKDSPRASAMNLLHWSWRAGPQLSEPRCRQSKQTNRRRRFPPACTKTDFAKVWGKTLTPKILKQEPPAHQPSLKLQGAQHLHLRIVLERQGWAPHQKLEKTVEGRLLWLKILDKMLLSEVNFCRQKALDK